MFKKLAFTLAEVLITLGIIGVVAAITIPSLVTSYQKHVVETKLAKFNSMINQAVRLSAADNGDPDSWVELGKNYSYKQNLEFLNTYLLPYMKYVRIYENPKRRGHVIIVLLDGSLFSFGVDINGADIACYINGKVEGSTRNSFAFQFTKRNGFGSGINSTSYIEPYIFLWDGTFNDLKTNQFYACKKGCTNCAFCTKLIQLNGWKIPKDYPW